MHKSSEIEHVFEREASAAGKQVSGWLLLFVLVLVVIFPAQVFYQIVFRELPPLLRGTADSPVSLLAIKIVCFGAVAVYSFLAGLKLWLIKPGAVQFVRRYLLTYLVAQLSYLVVCVILTQPIQRSILAETGFYHAAAPIAQFTLWWVYLDHSKRVG